MSVRISEVYYDKNDKIVLLSRVTVPDNKGYVLW